MAALSLGLTGLIPGSIYATAPKLAPTSALLAIVLGLINQTTNVGNLLGPAATALVVDTFGWNRAPLLFGSVAIAGVTVALGLRACCGGRWSERNSEGAYSRSILLSAACSHPLLFR